MKDHFGHTMRESIILGKLLNEPVIRGLHAPGDKFFGMIKSEIARKITGKYFPKGSSETYEDVVKTNGKMFFFDALKKGILRYTDTYISDRDLSKDKRELHAILTAAYMLKQAEPGGFPVNINTASDLSRQFISKNNKLDETNKLTDVNNNKNINDTLIDEAGKTILDFYESEQKQFQPITTHENETTISEGDSVKSTEKNPSNYR
jgi:hypothetical protein